MRAADRRASADSVLQWRAWPLAEHKTWSWLVVVGVLAIGGICAYLANSWLPGLLAVVGLTITLWQFFVPVNYAIDSMGIRRSALGRTHVIEWPAACAYQERPTGMLLFQRPDPIAIDALRSTFIPFPADDDEVLCALREYLSHAFELPS